MPLMPGRIVIDVGNAAGCVETKLFVPHIASILARLNAPERVVLVDRYPIAASNLPNSGGVVVEGLFALYGPDDEPYGPDVLRTEKELVGLPKVPPGFSIESAADAVPKNPRYTCGFC